MTYRLYTNCTRRSGIGAYAIGDDYLTGALAGEFDDETDAYIFAQDNGLLRPCYDDEGGPGFSTLDDMHMLIRVDDSGSTQVA